MRFGSRWLFQGLDFAWEPPSFVSVTGPSGSGKTTLLGVISGSIQASAGDCIAETDENRPPSSAGWIVQNSPLLVSRTALENVSLGPLFQRVPPSESLARAEQEMARLGIEHLAKVRAKKLSGGERQRVTVARALASRARLILADEPTSSLDAEAKVRVATALRTAADDGALVIMATHDKDVAAFADTVFDIGQRTT
ncbi:ATP-binding cassette domain-containing protein [Microbacterium maritypicum]|uniref:ATP-binding cassette domain-containing protein n=1 Tax=Microbacterium maritypicum TaxID=33918 RepID=UPI003CEFDA98